MTPDSMSLQRLIDPLPLEEFLRDYKGKRHIHIPGAADKFADIFSWDTANRLLDTPALWTGNLVSLAKEGPLIPQDQYCLPDVDADGYAVMRPDPAKVQKFIAEGATLVLNVTESLTAPLADVASCLQMSYGMPIKCNIYCSWERQKGFRSHFDHTDVFVLHMDGRKHWNLYEGFFDQPMSGTEFQFAHYPPEFHEETKGRVLEEPELTPGDLLYIPRGQYHDALALSEASLHLTFGVIHATGIDLMTVLRSHLREEPEFRAPLPHFDDPDAHEAHLRALVDGIADTLGRDTTIDFICSHLRGTAYMECLPHFGLPDRDGVAVFRVRRANAGVRSALAGEAAEVADWALTRDYFVADSLAEAFADWDTEKLLAILQELADKGLIEQRP